MEIFQTFFYVIKRWSRSRKIWRVHWQNPSRISRNLPKKERLPHLVNYSLIVMRAIERRKEWRKKKRVFTKRKRHFLWLAMDIIQGTMRERKRGGRQDWESKGATHREQSQEIKGQREKIGVWILLDHFDRAASPLCAYYVFIMVGYQESSDKTIQSPFDE